MITNAKKYEEIKFIYKKEMSTEEQILKEKDEIVGTESKEEGMSNDSETESKNKQEKKKVNKQKRKKENENRYLRKDQNNYQLKKQGK